MALVASACANGSTDEATTTSGDAGQTETTAAPVITTTEPTTATTTTAPAVTTTMAIVESGETSLGNPLEVGRVSQVGSWRLRVVSVIPDATEIVMTENEFNDPPGEGEQFYLVTIEATYNGDASGSFWADMTLKSVGESAVAYEPFDSDCGIITDDINNSGETFPGGTITGDVCWTIESTDAESLIMIAEESFTFDDTRAFLSLDPSATPVDESTSISTPGDGTLEADLIGTTVSVGAWDITVIAVTPDDTDTIMEEHPFNNPPDNGEQFFVAHLEATYTGDESGSFWVDMTLKAVGKSRVAYEPFEANCGSITDDINNTGETFPGGTIIGNTCWKVNSSDVETLVMIAEESFTFDETRVFLSLTE